MPGKTILLVTLSLFAGGGLLNGEQTASPEDTKQSSTLSVTVKVVNVPATVRDKHGQIISNLAKDDFVLEEDGVRKRSATSPMIRICPLPLAFWWIQA